MCQLSSECKTKLQLMRISLLDKRCMMTCPRVSICQLNTNCKMMRLWKSKFLVDTGCTQLPLKTNSFRLYIRNRSDCVV